MPSEKCYHCTVRLNSIEPSRDPAKQIFSKGGLMEIQERGRGYLLYQRSGIYRHPSPLPPVQTTMLSGGRGRVLFVVTLRGLCTFVV